MSSLASMSKQMAVLQAKSMERSEDRESRMQKKKSKVTMRLSSQEELKEKSVSSGA